MEGKTELTLDKSKRTNWERIRNLLNLQRSSFMQPALPSFAPGDPAPSVGGTHRAFVPLTPASSLVPPETQHDVCYRHSWNRFNTGSPLAEDSAFKSWPLRWFKPVPLPLCLLLLWSTGNWFLPDSHPFLRRCSVQTSSSSLLMLLFSLCSICLPRYFSAWWEGYLPRGNRVDRLSSSPVR